MNQPPFLGERPSEHSSYVAHAGIPAAQSGDIIEGNKELHVAQRICLHMLVAAAKHSMSPWAQS